MKGFLSILFVAYFASGPSGFSAIQDPEADYVATPASVCTEYGITKTAEVLRLDLDLAGDGRPIAFLTFSGTGSKAGPIWTAYTPRREGFDRVDGIQFRQDFLRAGKVPGVAPNGGLVVFFPGKGGGKLMLYQVRGGEKDIQDLGDLDYSISADQERFTTIFNRKVGEPPPEDYISRLGQRVIKVEDIISKSEERKKEGAPETQKKEAEKLQPQPNLGESYKGTNGGTKGVHLWVVWTVIAVFGLLLLVYIVKRPSK